jgi:hypothetical protein
LPAPETELDPEFEPEFEFDPEFDVEPAVMFVWAKDAALPRHNSKQAA